MKVKKPVSSSAGEVLRPSRKSSRVPSSRSATSSKPPVPAELAEWIEKAKSLPAVREELVARVKAEIDAGTYETPEKLDIAIERLIDEFCQ